MDIVRKSKNSESLCDHCRYAQDCTVYVSIGKCYDILSCAMDGPLPSIPPNIDKEKINMKTFTITFDNKNDMDTTFDNLFEVFKDNNDFKSGNILICKTTEDGTNRIYLHVLDKAADSVSNTIQRYIVNIKTND